MCQRRWPSVLLCLQLWMLCYEHAEYSKQYSTMKKVILIMLPSLLLAACRPQPSLPEATKAAYEIYTRFSECENLSVAFLGGYNNDTCTINAVMLQAKDTLAWLQLFEQFGVAEKLMSLQNNPPDRKNVKDSVYMGNGEGTRQFLESKAEAMADRLQRFRETGDSSLAPSSPSPLVESWVREMKIGASLIIDLDNLTMWVFLYCDIDELRDIFCFLYGNVWNNVIKDDEERDLEIYTSVGK